MIFFKQSCVAFKAKEHNRKLSLYWVTIVWEGTQHKEWQDVGQVMSAQVSLALSSQ